VNGFQPRGWIPTATRLVRRSKQRLWVTLVVAVLATTAVVVVDIQPASAAAPPGCPVTFLCFYADPDFSGGMGQVSGTNSNFRAFLTSNHNCGNGNWNDCVSSVFNNGSSCTALLWRDATFAPTPPLSLARNFGYTNLKNQGFDDVLSSNSWQC
jgi:hypothetical protein